MKSAHDPRHLRRREIVKDLFAHSFEPQKVKDEARVIIDNEEEIDRKIQESAPQWPIDKLNKIDLAILRLAVYEISKEEIPPKVVIDEAVELAKEFGGESSPSFINGVLGNILKQVEEKNE